jgi:hypothetical protein
VEKGEQQPICEEYCPIWLNEGNHEKEEKFEEGNYYTMNELEGKPPIRIQDFIYAVQKGDLSRLKSLYKEWELANWISLEIENIDVRVLCHKAAEKGHLDCLQWLHETGCPRENDCDMGMALKNNHLNCLKYFIENVGRQVSKWDMETATEFGSLDCLLYLHEKKLLRTDCELCDKASWNGQLTCLKWLHENGHPWSTTTIRYAVYQRQLECLVYLHENGCPWDEGAVHSGVENYLNDLPHHYHDNRSYEIQHEKDLECLIYLGENGCPFYIEPQWYDNSDAMFPSVYMKIWSSNHQRYRKWIIGYFPEHEDALSEQSKHKYNTILEEETGKKSIEDWFGKDIGNYIMELILFSCLKL